jgi:DNA-binding winged helix-turn-helix (wHTH) protein
LHSQRSTPPPPDAAGYRFDDVEIDLRRRELRVVGVVEAVEPRVYELIVTLIEGRERAFGKDELVDLLWGRPVSDASLSQLVYKARRVLREDDSRCFIQTVRGHGFRWGGEVEIWDASADSVPAQSHSQPREQPARLPRALDGIGRSRWSIAGVVLASVVAGVAILWWRGEAHGIGSSREVLVLPLDNRTGEDGLAWTQDGLPGLLVSVLNRMPELHGVVGRPTAQPIGIKDAEKRRAAHRRGRGRGGLFEPEPRRLCCVWISCRRASRGATVRFCSERSPRRWRSTLPIASVNGAAATPRDRFPAASRWTAI